MIIKEIQPNKPVLMKDYYSCIVLNKNQVDNGSVEFRSRIKKEGFREQKFRHITVFSVKNLCTIENAFNGLSVKEKKDKLIKFKKLLISFEWRYVQKEIYLVKKRGKFGKSKILENRESYIRIIKMPDLVTFFHKLNLLLGTNIPVQFPHITLYTKGERPGCEYYGISIPSKTDFLNMHPRKITIKTETGGKNIL